MNKIGLLVIDPQNSFCDPSGALFVPGAQKDMSYLSEFINRNLSKIDDIKVTLDSHHLIDIAHPNFWKNENNENPEPFTIISYKDVLSETWTPVDITNREIALSYVASLEEKGNFPLCIWPPHCLIGTEGHNVYPIVNIALQNWTIEKNKNVRYIQKGQNIFTEHFGALAPEVELHKEISKKNSIIKSEIITYIYNFDKIYVVGEAGSHCVNITVRQICENLGEMQGEICPKIHLLTDAMSPVPNFENEQEKFIFDMKEKGIQIASVLDTI